ncbi:MAG: outer membrane lipid asymmetry maintenance protein MlaD [Alphaproteobacteria bacterium]|nr:outer membrane lipid asymmetry maintenance protein MlaD [Alphaproteobacteria bacterium]HCP00772.1 outer membrane lipid asymmetry maintenance protein MlaD [Rhodospirillaceae bacterium]
MNESSQREIRNVLIGILASVVLVALLALVFGPTRAGGGSTVDISAVFGRADGLQIGAPVHAAGVQVGEVAALELTDRFRVRAILRIDPSVNLDTDASATIVTDGIFGGKLVRLDIGGGDQMIGDGDQIGFTEDAIVLDDLLELIISQAKAAQKEDAK